MMRSRVPAVRIMVYVPRRHCWAAHKTVTSRPELDRELQAVADRKVRLMRTTTIPPAPEKPPYVSPTTRFRIAQAQRMSDQRDATRYYKSPG
jgi:hypothetical protein